MSMKVLRESDSIQEIVFLPSSSSENMTAIVIDEETKEIVNEFSNDLIGSLMSLTWDQIDVLWDYAEDEWAFPPLDPDFGNYAKIGAVFNLKQEHTYDIKVFDENGSVIYFDKIFCTNQPIDQMNNEYYSVNKNKYTYE